MSVVLVFCSNKTMITLKPELLWSYSWCSSVDRVERSTKYVPLKKKRICKCGINYVFILFGNHCQACQQYQQHSLLLWVHSQTLSNSVKKVWRQLPLEDYPTSLLQDCQSIQLFITFQLSIKRWYTLLSLSIKHIFFQTLQLHHLMCQQQRRRTSQRQVWCIHRV